MRDVLSKIAGSDGAARLAVWLFFLLLSGCAPSHLASPARDGAQIEVMVIATLHSGHVDNPQYSYDDLYNRIQAFEPDIVGVEIRQEDIGRASEYLARNYPLEMRVVAERYSDSVVGIDWLGSDLAGRPIPPDYWRDQSEIKRLQREFGEETLYATPQMETAGKLQAEILARATPSSLNDGRYDEATREYYAALADAVGGTRFARLSEFYAERDRRIGEAVSKVVERFLPGPAASGRIVFVVGADHRGPLVEQLSKRFGQSIRLVSVD